MSAFRRGLYIVFGLTFAVIAYTLLAFGSPPAALFVAGVAILAVIGALFVLAFAAVRRAFR